MLVLNWSELGPAIWEIFEKNARIAVWISYFSFPDASDALDVIERFWTYLTSLDRLQLGTPMKTVVCGSVDPKSGDDWVVFLCLYI